MRYLLDTHIIMWALVDHPKLPKRFRDLILDPENQIYYSCVSPWEAEIKHLKKPESFFVSGKQLASLCDQVGFLKIPIENRHIDEIHNIVAIDASIRHEDPFDKMLLAQARSENMILLTHDKRFRNYNDSHLMVD